MPSRVIGDAGEDVGQVVLRVAAVELGAFDRRVQRRGAPTTGVGTGKEIVLAADRDAAQGALGGVVVERQAAIGEAIHADGYAGSTSCSPAAGSQRVSAV